MKGAWRSRDWRALAACLLIAAPCLHGSAVAAALAGPAFDDEVEAPLVTLTPRARAQARGALAAPVPADLGAEQLEGLMRFRYRQALVLGGDIAFREAERWVTLLPASPNALWAWGWVQLGRGRVAEFERLVAQAIEQTRRPSKQAWIAAETATTLLEIKGDFEAAGRWIERARRYAGVIDPRRGGQHARRGGLEKESAHQVWGRTMLREAEARLYSLRGRHDEARAAAAEALALALDAQRQATELGGGAAYARSVLVRAWSAQAEVQLQAGYTFDAERSLRAANAVLASAITSSALRFELQDLAAELRLEQARYVEAEALAVDSLARSVPAPGAAPSAGHVRARLQLQDALAGQQRWLDAWVAMQQTDLLADAAPDLRRTAQDPLVRGWVLLELGEAALARAVLEPAYRTQLALLGPRHLGTALTACLAAWALWDDGDRPAALKLYDEALPNLTAPLGTAAGFVDQGLQRPLRKAIAEAYLRAVAATGDESRAVGAIRVADWLMGAAVEDAVADAAERSALAPGVQDRVRREQDLRHRAQALQAAMNRVGDDTAAALDPAERRAIQAQLLQVNADYLAARDEMLKVLPAARGRAGTVAVDAAAIAQRLGDGQAFIVLLPAAQATYVWAVTKDRAPQFRAVAVDEREVTALVARLRATVELPAAAAQPRFDAAAAANLHAALFGSLQGALQDRSQLIVAAGGALARLPLALLLEAPWDGTDAATAPWLIRRVSLSQVPTARAWLALKGQRSSRLAAEPLLGWADPAFGPAPEPSAAAVRRVTLTRADTAEGLDYHRIPALPETRDELQAIATALGADLQRDLRLGARATRQSVIAASESGELARKRVVAFATHGLVAGDLPQLNQPALALAATGQEEQDPLAPLLKLDDVLHLKLDADWVVLSACNTAAADGKAEEALSGLARGFFYAGARSLLVTHWAVETESAKLLTTGTFTYYASHPEAGKAESLRQAILRVMADPKYGHPAYWAPYAVVGDGGR